MLRCLEGSASTDNRERGFLDAMKEFPDITIVSANQYGGPTVETAYRASKTSLHFKGVYRQTYSSTGFYSERIDDLRHAARPAGCRMRRKCLFVGFDSSTKLVEALQNKHINALVLQNPFRMGYDGVTTGGQTSPRREGRPQVGYRRHSRDTRQHGPTGNQAS